MHPGQLSELISSATRRGDVRIANKGVGFCRRPLGILLATRPLVLCKPFRPQGDNSA